MDICQRIYTTRDTNGNARAIWLAYYIGQEPDIHIMQGYMESGGNRPKQLRGYKTLPPMQVTPKEYQETLRVLKQQGQLTP